MMCKASGVASGDDLMARAWLGAQFRGISVSHMQMYHSTISHDIYLLTLSQLLLETSHGGFPIVRNSDDAAFVGLITRAELLIILVRYGEGGKKASKGMNMNLSRTYYPF
jgi:CBS domain-containing protein